MDAFEQLVAELHWSLGYWVRTSVKVSLTKEEKVSIGRPSAPRWELDVVCYKADVNELLVLECKSYLNSPGVRWADICGESASKRYKLFREPLLRQTVLNRLCEQMVETGSCNSGVTAKLGLAAGNLNVKDQAKIEQDFVSKGWILLGPDWLRTELRRAGRSDYENLISSVTAKLLR